MPTPLPPLHTIAVYCSASADVDPVFRSTATHLGQALAQHGFSLVYGGNKTGCMDDLATGFRSVSPRKGKVIGVTPQLFVDKNHHDTDADELLVTPNMRERKLAMEHRADAFIALPGGLGTYEELFEQLVNRQLNYHQKPILLLNINYAFDPLHALLEHGISHHFIKPKARNIYRFTTTIEETIDLLLHPDKLPPAANYHPAALSHEAAGGH
jgi:uncharacterized protein (TIGR00730 family)